jgi:NAD(P)H dehydrogenase (quinone)
VIAVTGATGALGGRVAARVAAAGDVPLRLVVRDADRAPRLPSAEVVENPGGYADPAGFRSVLEGVDALYLVSAAEAEDRLQQHLDAVDAAVAAGVQRIVYTSFLGARHDAVFTLVRQHAATEDRIRAAGEGRTSFVSRDDLADVGAAMLLDDSGRFDGQALEVTGPEALSMADAADVLGEVTGIPAQYRPQTVEEAWATRRPSGHPDWEVEGWVTSYLAIAAGELSTVTDVVPRVTGHPALTVGEHLRRHPEDWAHLRG